MDNICTALLSHSFIDTLNECYLFQHVTQPTRHRHGEVPSVLDLVIYNEEGMVKNLNYSAGLGASDHVILGFDLICYTEYHKQTCNKLDYGRANFKLLKSKVGKKPVEIVFVPASGLN